jgi:3-oxoacyl-[acyl-carrier protein] reductase
LGRVPRIPLAKGSEYRRSFKRGGAHGREPRVAAPQGALLRKPDLPGRALSRTALVTGAARGIGLATAEALLAAGHRVALVDRDADAVRSAAARLQADRALAIAQDVAQPGAGEALDRAVRERWDPVAILVNNAGIPSPRRAGRTAGLAETTPEEWNAVLEVNLTAAQRLCRQFIPAMRERRWGRIVNVSSLAGRSRTYISGVSYMASKAALLALARSIAGEFGRDGVTANCVAPGYIATAMAALHGEEKNAEIAKRIPLGRAGTPQEVAAAIAFLASEEAAYMNGAVIDVNGGIFMS